MILIPVAPPEEVQRRAWECAFMLRADFADRLTLEQRIRIEVAYRAPRLGWSECHDMLLLWRCIAGVRV